VFVQPCMYTLFNLSLALTIKLRMWCLLDKLNNNNNNNNNNKYYYYYFFNFYMHLYSRMGRNFRSGEIMIIILVKIKPNNINIINIINLQNV